MIEDKEAGLKISLRIRLYENACEFCFNKQPNMNWFNVFATHYHFGCWNDNNGFRILTTFQSKHLDLKRFRKLNRKARTIEL